MTLEIKHCKFGLSNYNPCSTFRIFLFRILINPLLNNVSFTINKGENIAIIGESGCGKSTLLKLMYGLYDLDEGKIFYNEKPVLGPKYNLDSGNAIYEIFGSGF